MTREKQIQCIQLIREGFSRLIASKMVLIHKDVQIFNTRGFPVVKSEGFKRDFTFKFGNDGRNESGLGVKSLRNTHAKRINTGR